MSAPINVRDLVPGTSVVLAGGAVAEIVTNPGDGMWLFARYLTSPSDPTLVGQEEMIFAPDVAALGRPAAAWAHRQSRAGAPARSVCESIEIRGGATHWCTHHADIALPTLIDRHRILQYPGQWCVSRHAQGTSQNRRQRWATCCMPGQGSGAGAGLGDTRPVDCRGRPARAACLYERAHRIVFTLVLQLRPTGKPPKSSPSTSSMTSGGARRLRRRERPVLGWIMNGALAGDRPRALRGRRSAATTAMCSRWPRRLPIPDVLELREQGESLRAALTRSRRTSARRSKRRSSPGLPMPKLRRG
jgi:hypothetical protein